MEITGIANKDVLDRLHRLRELPFLFTERSHGVHEEERILEEDEELQEFATEIEYIMNNKAYEP